MTDLAASRVGARADRLDRAFAGVRTRFAPLFPGGEIQDTGHAIWTVSTTPLRVVNGVIRYDARDFHGPVSERELDSCLAVLSTYDVPWRFSAWDHLGADVLVPHLVARGMVGTGSAPAMWLDLPGCVLTTAGEDSIEIRSVSDASDHHERPRSSPTCSGSRASTPTCSSRWSPSPARAASSPMRTVTRSGA